MVGFFKQQEKRIAIRMLTWQYQRMKIPIPSMEELGQQADRIVEDAHRIARERGSNVISILKEMVGDLAKRKDNS
jgi:hypothetical protein